MRVDPEHSALMMSFMFWLGLICGGILAIGKASGLLDCAWWFVGLALAPFILVVLVWLGVLVLMAVVFFIDMRQGISYTKHNDKEY